MEEPIGCNLVLIFCSTENLNQSAKGFQTVTQKVETKMQWKNRKVCSLAKKKKYISTCPCI